MSAELSSKAQLDQNLGLLRQILKILIADRYKQMARDEVLSRFIQKHVDPVLLVDASLHIEREALSLTEMSLLSLVTSSRMNAEVRRAAEKIQKSFQEIYGEESDVVHEFCSPELLHLRTDCLRARVDFFNPFLTVTGVVNNVFDLALKAFNKVERFEKKLTPVLEADRRYGEELVRETEATHRFLMKKQMDYELEKAEELWTEFQGQAFRSPRALP